MEFNVGKVGINLGGWYGIYLGDKGSLSVYICLECFHCYVIIIDCLFISFDMLYFSTDGCINKSLTYLLTVTASHTALCR